MQLLAQGWSPIEGRSATVQIYWSLQCSNISLKSEGCKDGSGKQSAETSVDMLQYHASMHTLHCHTLSSLPGLQLLM